MLLIPPYKAKNPCQVPKQALHSSMLINSPTNDHKEIPPIKGERKTLKPQLQCISQ